MSVRLIAKVHPFDETQRIVKDAEKAPLRALYESLGVPLSIEHARFMINDRTTGDPEEIPNDGDLVCINVVPGGADNQQRATGKAEGWAGAGLVALGVIISVAAGWTGVGAVIGGSLIGAGISLFAAGVVTYNTPTPSLTSRDQVESAPYLRGSRNKSNLGGPAPLILGRHRIAPHNGAAPYTEIVGNDQYLRQLFVVGQKDLSIEAGTWKIGDTALSKYDSEMQTVVDGSVPSFYPTVVRETGVGREIRHLDDEGASGAIIITTPSNTNEIIIDLAFNGLVNFNDKNEKKNASVEIIAEYKIEGAADSSYKSLGTWRDGSNVITAATTKTLRLVMHKVLDNAASGGSDWSALRKYDVRLTRVTADSTTSSTIDKAYWGSLRAVQNLRPITQSVQADLCVASLRIKATGQLSGVVDQLSCVANLSARDYNGAGSGAGAWSARVTANPASCYLYVLTNSSASPRPMPDSKIDWPTLESWHAFCAANGYECNLVLDAEMDRDSLLAIIAECGRAIPVKLKNKFSVVIDRARSSPMQMITPRNSWDYSGSKDFADIPHALKMNFVNKDLDWQQDQLIVYNDGYNLDGSGGKTQASVFQEVECKGATNAAQVWKIGRYKIAASVLRCETHTVSMDLEYLTANLGDRVLFAHDVILVGLSYPRINALIIDGLNVTGIVVDESIEIESGKSYAVTIRSAIGISTVGVTASVGIVRELTLSVPVPVGGIAAGDLVAFGEGGKVTIDAIVMDIDARDDQTAVLTLVDYAPELFALIDDPNLEIPAHDPKISRPGSDQNSPPITSVYDVNATILDLQSQVASAGAISGSANSVPANVTDLTAVAAQGAINISCAPVTGENARTTAVGYIFQRSTDAGETWKDINGEVDGLAVVATNIYAWEFDRATDGYPEAAAFSDYRFRAKAVNIAGIVSLNWTTISIIDVSTYGTWLPAKIASIVGSSAQRRLSADWATATVYGLLRYEARIRQYSGDPATAGDWYAPGCPANQTVYDSETNYRVSDIVGAVTRVSTSQYTLSVPLLGQAAGNCGDTAYDLEFRVVSARPWSQGAAAGCVETDDHYTAGPWSDPVELLAKASGAYDLVFGRDAAGAMQVGAIRAEHLYVENLAAIVGNLAVLSGGVDDPHNYWCLSDYPGKPVGRSVGDFRVGNADNYLLFRASDGTLTFRITSFRVSTLLTRLKGTLEISDQGDVDAGLTHPLMLSTAGSGCGYIGLSGNSSLLALYDGYLKINGSLELLGNEAVLLNGTNKLNIGYTTTSWGGQTIYPTLYSTAPDEWVMIVNPHVPFNRTGTRGFTGGTQGSRIRFAGSTATEPPYWDVGVGIDGAVTDDLFGIGRNGIIKFGIASGGGLYHWNGDSSKIVYGPNATWASYLIVGSGPDSRPSAAYAQVISTNGNLHLDSGNSTRDLLLQYYAQGNTYINPNSGNVAIGTTDPAGYKLRVNGSIRSDGLLRVYGQSEFHAGTARHGICIQHRPISLRCMSGTTTVLRIPTIDGQGYLVNEEFANWYLAFSYLYQYGYFVTYEEYVISGGIEGLDPCCLFNPTPDGFWLYGKDSDGSGTSVLIYSGNTKAGHRGVIAFT